jgi:hypothetical protein
MFVTYFRVIKKAPSSPLLPSALEGIGRCGRWWRRCVAGGVVTCARADLRT